MKGPKILELDFSKLPEDLSDAKIEGQLMALDNLGCVIDSDKRQVAEGYCYPTHTDLSVFVLCVRGEVDIRVNLKLEELKSNHLLIIMQGTIFEVLKVSEDFEGAVIVMNSEVYQLTADAIVGMSLRQYFTLNHQTPLSDEHVEEYLNIYRMMKRTLLDQGNPFREQIIQKYFQILTYSAYNAFFKSKARIPVKRNRKDELFENFIRLVEHSYMRERSVKYYADSLCLSSKYLSSVIKEVSNKFAGEWIDDYVILESKALLKQGNCTIQQIADRLHFPNQSFFGRYFKHHTGYSPKDYRKL